MKNVICKLLLSVMLISITNGCVLFHNPLKDYNNIEKKLSSIEDKVILNSNSINKQVSGYVYASTLSLDNNPYTNSYTTLAKDLNYKALALLPPPSIEDINVYKKMVSDLLSTNELIIKRGNEELSKMDAKVIELQKRNEELSSKLSNTEKTANEIFGKNSSLAQKWSNLTKYIWLSVYVFVGVILLRIVAAACPPPYNSIVQVLALPFTWVIHTIKALIPEAIHAAGWVESQYKVATSDLVNAIHEIKTTNPSLHSQISSIVASNTSDISIPIINNTKSDNNIVS